MVCLQDKYEMPVEDEDEQMTGARPCSPDDVVRAASAASNGVTHADTAAHSTPSDEPARLLSGEELSARSYAALVQLVCQQAKSLRFDADYGPKTHLRLFRAWSSLSSVLNMLEQYVIEYHTQLEAFSKALAEWRHAEAVSDDAAGAQAPCPALPLCAVELLVPMLVRVRTLHLSLYDRLREPPSEAEWAALSPEQRDQVIRCSASLEAHRMRVASLEIHAESMVELFKKKICSLSPQQFRAHDVLPQAVANYCCDLVDGLLSKYMASVDDPLLTNWSMCGAEELREAARLAPWLPDLAAPKLPDDSPDPKLTHTKIRQELRKAQAPKAVLTSEAAQLCADKLADPHAGKMVDVATQRLVSLSMDGPVADIVLEYLGLQKESNSSRLATTMVARQNPQQSQEQNQARLLQRACCLAKAQAKWDALPRTVKKHILKPDNSWSTEERPNPARQTSRPENVENDSQSKDEEQPEAKRARHS